MNNLLIKQPTTEADLAFEKFRQLFPPLLKVDVLEDRMLYRFRNMVLARSYCNWAQKVIMQHHLPLEANVETWSHHDVVFEINIEIRFVPSMQDIPCY